MAGVIKGERYAATGSFSFRDLESDAERILARARAQAEEIVSAAQGAAAEEIARQLKQAAAEGHATGRKAGLAEIQREARERVTTETRAEVTAAVQALTTGLQELDQRKRRLLAEAETGLVELAMAIARRVCKVLGDSAPDVAIANARQVLETVGPQADLELHIHPDEHAAVQKWAADFIAACDELEHVTVVPDVDVPRGGCVLRGRQVTVDATLETQLDRVAAAICPSATPDDSGQGDE